MTQSSAPVVLVTPHKPALIEGAAQKLAVLIRVQAPDAPAAVTANRKPYHLALVIDHDLLQMHETIMLIDPNWDPSLTQR